MKECNHAFAVDYQSDAEYRCVKCGALMKELGLVITKKENVKKQVDKKVKKQADEQQGPSGAYSFARDPEYMKYLDRSH